MKQNDSKFGILKNLEVDCDQFNRALANVRYEGQQPDWMRMDLLKADLDLNDKQAVLREIERFKLEKGELAC